MKIFVRICKEPLYGLHPEWSKWNFFFLRNLIYLICFSRTAQYLTRFETTAVVKKPDGYSDSYCYNNICIWIHIKDYKAYLPNTVRNNKKVRVKNFNPEKSQEKKNNKYIYFSFFKASQIS